ncbi:glycosyltransferase [Polaribacter sp. Z014]|uniref:glycosyltransferase family 2 protein n=1 Tax=Polaribacter sp. Z014 TaxID=2927126 RepID=UPI0020210D19|nr:glycosyltransferase [Polaribacter sp. Z014]MCL7764203.1 glycosyltransferase [Polaribacter sp. Z014]
MLISIIIPTYNRAHIISETLNSIIAQTYRNWECIIVDDGSTDGTITVIDQYIKKDNRFQYHKRPSNRLKGANACRNYGFELSKGDCIQWFDSDDLYLKEAFETYINNFKSNINVVISPLRKVDFKMRSLSISKIESEDLINNYLIGKVAFFVSGPMWKTSFLKEQKHLFDEKLGNLDDWDFNLRMLYKQPVIKFLEKPLILYRIHENSFSHEIGKLNRIEIDSEFKARQKHLSLLKKYNYNNELKTLKYFILTRYIYFIKQSLIARKYKLLINLYLKYLKYSFKYLDIRVIKVSVGTVLCVFFNKGYKWVK